MGQGTIERAYSKGGRRRQRKAVAAAQAAAPQPKPVVREVYEPAVAKHEDDRVIPGLSGRGAILRADNLKKLWDAGKINAVQYSAGIDYLEIVEAFFVTASGLAKADDMAGKVGGDGDPIRRYLKARPAHIKADGTVIGYIPTQRPRHPSGARRPTDGWTHAKLNAMSKLQGVQKVMDRMTRDQRTALCVLVIDPERPFIRPLTLSAATRRMFGYRDTACLAKLVRWLSEALDQIEPEVHQLRMAA